MEEREFLLKIRRRSITKRCRNEWIDNYCKGTSRERFLWRGSPSFELSIGMANVCRKCYAQVGRNKAEGEENWHSFCLFDQGPKKSKNLKTRVSVSATYVSTSSPQKGKNRGVQVSSCGWNLVSCFTKSHFSWKIEDVSRFWPFFLKFFISVYLLISLDCVINSFASSRRWC